jgi:predicted SAM-dependent methyltransferase
MSKQKILNLGCGHKHIKSTELKTYVNVDMYEPADVVADVREGLPFPDNNFDRVEADNLLEHFDPEEFLFVMNEIYRVTKKGGILWFRVPDALSWFDGAYGDPTHKKFFVPRSFKYFQKGGQQYENYGKYYRDRKGQGLKGWELVNLTTNKMFYEYTGRK